VGLFIIDADFTPPGLPGVALYLSIELSVGAAPEGEEPGVGSLDGIFELQGEVILVLNTTMRNQEFVIPDEFLRLMPEGTEALIVIGASIPSITGTPNQRNDGIDNDLVNGIDDVGEGDDPSIYIVATIRGSIQLFDTITLAGLISFSASANTEGAYVRITGAVSANIQYVGALSGSLDLRFYTNYNNTGLPAIFGRATLALAGGGAIPGVTLAGYIVLDIKSIDGAVVLDDTPLTNYELTRLPGKGPAMAETTRSLDHRHRSGRRQQHRPGRVHHRSDTPAQDYNLRLKIVGELVVGPLVRCAARFYFEFDATPFSVRMGGSATLELVNFIQFDVNLALVIDARASRPTWMSRSTATSAPWAWASA
jgi:hypothetical protein